MNESANAENEKILNNTQTNHVSNKHENIVKYNNPTFPKINTVNKTFFNLVYECFVRSKRARRTALKCNKLKII